ncbi:MAG: helix-turn-helix transcriptional regulator [Acholeplasmatales bacterium]|nr:helix-turn-helix transcriptional regulator [Acholeplasmatales bacterium]
MSQQVFFKKNLNFLTTHTLISQAELSRQIGISRQAVHNLITRDENPRLSTILKISEIYNIDASDLLFVDLEEKYKDKKTKISWDV